MNKKLLAKKYFEIIILNKQKYKSAWLYNLIIFYTKKNLYIIFIRYYILYIKFNFEKSRIKKKRLKYLEYSLFKPFFNLIYLLALPKCTSYNTR